jgi:hypothetical protein
MRSSAEEFRILRVVRHGGSVFRLPVRVVVMIFIGIFIGVFRGVFASQKCQKK